MHEVSVRNESLVPATVFGERCQLEDQGAAVGAWIGQRLGGSGGGGGEGGGAAGGGGLAGVFSRVLSALGLPQPAAPATTASTPAAGIRLLRAPVEGSGREGGLSDSSPILLVRHPPAHAHSYPSTLPLRLTTSAPSPSRQPGTQVCDESLAELNARRAASGLPPAPLERFRPNLVVSGCAGPHAGPHTVHYPHRAPFPRRTA